MNKGDLINSYAAAAGIKVVEAKTAVETISEIIESTLLSGEEVTIPGVGKLKVVVKDSRNGRNPKTGEPIVIPTKRVVKFSPSDKFEEAISPVA